MSEVIIGKFIHIESALSCWKGKSIMSIEGKDMEKRDRDILRERLQEKSQGVAGKLY